MQRTCPGQGLRAGDANRDGVVNQFDFSLLSANFNQANTTWDQGNFNDQGGTDQFDFSILSANFNQAGTPPAISAVPEPAGLALLGMGLLGLALRGSAAEHSTLERSEVRQSKRSFLLMRCN